jgi:streptogramin lyase
VLTQGYQLARVGPDGVTQALFSPGILPTVMTFDPSDGGAWYANDNQVGHMTPDGKSESWWLPDVFSYSAYDIVIGPDDYIWIATNAGVARVSRTGTSAFIDGTWGANDLTAGPDGNIWVSFGSRNAIGRITPAGTLTLFEQDGLNPQRIAAGADGKLWFTTGGTLKSISTSGTFSGTFSDSAYNHLVAGTDGRLWWNRPPSPLVKWAPGAAAVESTYDLGQTNAYLAGLSAGSSGVWWTSNFTIGRVTYAGDSQQWPFTPLGADAHSMVTLGNAIWFTAPEANQIGKMVDGTTTLYDLPHAQSGPLNITIGPDGALWFTEKTGDRVGRIDAAGTITEFTVPTVFGQPSGITTGPDGNLWITLAAADKIARLTPAGVFTEFNVPGLGSWPESIAAGSDGNLWFTQRDSAQIGRITPAGVVTEFIAGTGAPNAIVAAPDGNLWYGGNPGSYRMTTSGQRTQMTGIWSVFGHQRIVGPDGALWSNDPNGVIRITMDGTIHFYTAASSNPRGYGITTGPDGRIWFSDSDTQALVRLTEDEPVTGTGATLCLAPNGYVDGILASFVDPDPNPRPASQYTARVDWGDGTGSFNTQIIETSPGHFDVRGWHDYWSAESMDVKVMLTALPGGNRIGGTYSATAHMVTPALVPGTVDFTSSGGASSVPVNGPAGCGWVASKNATWIVFTNGSSGTGPGTLQYTVQPNGTFNARQGTITVGERTLTIRQAAAGGSGLYLITPCRLYDSRNTSSQIGPGAEWQISTIGSCGLPPDTKALVANVIVVNPAQAGWLSAYKNGTPWPGTSTVNYRQGRTRANNTIIPMVDAAFLIRNGGVAPVDFIVDVTGYFK